MPKRALASRFLLLAGTAFLIAPSCDDDEKTFAFFTDAEWATIQTLANLPAVPPADPTNLFGDTPAAAALGKQYFFDPRFSGPLTHAANDGVSAAANGTVGQTAKVSCARCHNPATGFSDQRTTPDETSLGAAFTGRNAPTLYNVDFNTWYFWDGRKDSLWSQALGPTESAVEHNGNRVQFAMVIRDNYRAAHEAIFGPLPAFVDDLDDPGVFNPAFPTPPAAPAFAAQGRPGDSATAPGGAATYDNSLSAAQKTAVDRIFADFGKALHAYQRLIVSRNSPFDKFVNGESGGVSLAAQRGLKLFIGKAQCVVCHNGPNLTDNAFHNIAVRQIGTHVLTTDNGRIDGIPAVLSDPFNGESTPFSHNPSAGAIKLNTIRPLPAPPNTLGRFKTPTLRSIAETGPYMHTGTIKTLEDVILFYDRGGDLDGFVGTNELVPLGLTSDERADLLAFLLTLDGEDLPASVTDAPTLPNFP